MPKPKVNIQALVDRINATSNADFVKRLLSGNKKHIIDADGRRRTHRLGYVESDGGAIVFPEVQSDGDTLREYPFPQSLDRAIERRDTLMMSIPEAEAFTTGYKEYYPDAEFGAGGKIHIKPSHRGRLTELKERTGKSEAELYNDGNPAHRKMVVFARNARKWKHADGGPLVDDPPVEGGERVMYDDLLRRGFMQVDPNEEDAFLGGEIEPAVVTAFRSVEPPMRRLPEDLGQEIPVQRDSFSQYALTPVVPSLDVWDVDRSLGPVSIPGRDSTAYFSAAASRLVTEARNFNPSGKSKNEIRDMQQSLADSGYYTRQLDGMSKDEIRKIQETLVSRGLLPSTRNADGSYHEVDGVVGKNTRAAWNRYNVDGQWGSRSRAAYNQRMTDAGGGNRWGGEYSARGISGCAEWVTKKYESVLGMNSKANGVFGDAWQMPMNVVNSGGQMLYNLYADGFDGVHSGDELQRRTRQRLKETGHIDYSILAPGDVVGIFYPPSTHHNDVLKEGTTYNTHVGIVTGYDEDGMPIVSHNIGQKVHNDRADHISYGVGQITVAARPNHTRTEAYPFQMGESQFMVELPEWAKAHSTPEKLQNLQTYMDAMAGAAPAIGKIYTNADMDAVQRIAVGVTRNETGYLQDTESSRTGVAGVRVGLENIARGLLLNQRPEDKSSDLTKFKLNTLTPDERAWLNIHEAKDLEDPANAGRAALLVLAKNYDYFARYAQENPQLGLTTQDIEDLTALSYNRGLGALSDFGTGKDPLTGERYVMPRRIESFRESAASDEVIDDFSATKLGRVADKLPVLEDIARFMFDNGMGTRSASYTNRVRQALETIKPK